jgi:muramidase (phage lysozyme)
MGILDDWDSMNVDFGPQSGSSSFGGGFSDDILFGGSGGDMLKPEDGLELLTPQERTQLTWDEQRQLIAERSAKIAAENGGGDSVKNPLAEVVAAPPSQPNYMSSETGQSISPNDPRLQTPEFDRVFGKQRQQQPEQFGPPMPSQSPNPMLDLANNPSLGQPQQPVDRKHPFLDLIGQAEGTDKGRGYNETLGYGKFTGGPVDLTSMTVNQVLDLQKQMLAHPENSFNSSAAGRYQIVSKTLRGLVDSGVVNGNDFFDESTQDKAAMALMQRRGADAAGLRNEWEGLRRVSPEAMLAAYNGAEVPAIERTRVADASNRFAPGGYPGGGSMPGPRTQGSPRMDGTQTPSDEDRIQAALRAYGGGNGGGGGMLGGLGGLLGGGGGGGSDNSAMMRAIGLSLLSSPRQAPLQNLAQNLALSEKQAEGAQTEKAAAAMAAYLGIDSRLAPLVAKNPQLMQMILQDRTQKENTRELARDPFLNPRAIPGQQSQAQPPAQQRVPAEPIADSGAPTDRSAGLKPDVVGTPEGYQWAGPGSQAEPQAPAARQEGIQVAAKGGAVPIPAIDARPIPQTPATTQVTSTLASQGRAIPATPEEAHALALDIGKRMALYEARGMKGAVEALKNVQEMYLKLALPTDIQRDVARAHPGDPKAQQRVLQAYIDKRTDLQKNSEFIAGPDPEKQRAVAERMAPDNRTEAERRARIALREPEVGNEMIRQSRATSAAPDDAETTKRLTSVSEFLGEIAKDAPKTAQRNADLDMLSRVVSRTSTSRGATLRAHLDGVAAELGLSKGKLATAQDAIAALTNRIAPTLRQPGSGAQSDAELRGFLASLPQLTSMPEGNQLVSATLKRAAEIDQKRADIASQWQAGKIKAGPAREMIAELDKTSIYASPKERALVEEILGASPKSGPEQGKGWRILGVE